MLVVGGVVQARGQDRDPRSSHRGRERGQDLVQPLAVVGHLAHPVGAVQLGKRTLHRVPATQHVGHPRWHAKVVLEHGEAVVGTHEVGAAHGDVDVVGHVDPPHLDPVLRAAEHQVQGDDSFAQRPPFVVDVLEEEVDGGEALLESPLDVLPLPGGQQARHEVERDDPLRHLVPAVHGEGDAFVQEPAVDALLELRHLLGDQPAERLHHLPAGGARSAVALEHLVVEPRLHLVAGKRRRSPRGLVARGFELGHRLVHLDPDAPGCGQGRERGSGPPTSARTARALAASYPRAPGATTPPDTPPFRPTSPAAGRRFPYHRAT